MALDEFDYRCVLTMKDNDDGVYNNVFYYKAQAGFAGSPVDLFVAWQDTVEQALRDVLHVSMVDASLSIVRLDGLGAFHEGNIAFAGGTVAGERMPNFVGWAFKIQRPFNTIRNGRKTFGRISESDVSNGVALDSGLDPATGRLTALENALKAPAQKAVTPATNYKICIPVSVNVAGDGEPPIYVLDRLVEASDVQYVRVSTQNSRKSF